MIDFDKNIDNFYIYTFYNCLSIENHGSFAENIRKSARSLDIIGTIILTPEGINSTIACNKASNLDKFILNLEKYFGKISVKRSESLKKPFKRLKIKIRNEVVPSGTEVKVDTSLNNYIKPEEWNDFITDKSVIAIDVRNDYEIGVGTFAYSKSPNTKNFREFNNYIKDSKNNFKNKKIAIFCTGGIRCEKASALFQANNVKNVYQLEGGIINYFDKAKSTDMWEGECFVFDDRVTVDRNLKAGNFKQCFACRRPLSNDDLKKPQYIEGISCHNCHLEKTDDDRKRFTERQKQKQK